MIYVSLNIQVIDIPTEMSRANSPKPFMRISTPDGVIDMTYNQAVMLAGAIKGSAMRFVDAGQLPESVLDPRWRTET